MEKLIEELLLSAPPDNALWKAWEYSAFREEEIIPPVLDLGCGDGKFARTIFPTIIEFGLDINWHRLKKAARIGVYRLPLQADACFLPFQDRYFGTVFSACALEHIPRVETVIEEVGRILKPGGKFIFSVPSHRLERYILAPEARHSPLLFPLKRTLSAVINSLLRMRHFYPPSRWDSLLSRSGMKLTRFRYILPPKAAAFWSHSFLWGNIVFPILLLLYRTSLKTALLQTFTAMIVPLLREPVKEGGALVLVAEKMA